jgi:hypothetical protein
VRETRVHWHLLLLRVVVPALVEPRLLVYLGRNLVDLMLNFRPEVGVGLIVDDVGGRSLTDTLGGTIAGRVCGEGLEVQNLCLVFDEGGSDGAAFSPLLGVQRQHARHCLIEEVTVLLLECAKQCV